jgi:4-amino-4-deoxy-L-arabinose transferase-like glycosyltransferase
MALALVLRLPRLGESLWFDEVNYATRDAAASMRELAWLSLNDPPAPFYRSLMFVWVRLFGEGELIVRLPSLLGGLFSIWLAFLVTRAHYGRKVALVVAVLLCFSPVHVWYSQEAAPYTLTLFFTLAAVLVFGRLRSGSPTPASYAVYLLMLLGAVSSHYLAVLLVFPLWLSCITTGRPDRRRIFAVHGMVLAFVAAALLVKSHWGTLRVGLGFLRPFTLFEWWMFFFHWSLHGNTLWTASPYQADLVFLRENLPLLIMQGACLALYVRGVVVGCRRGGRSGAWLLEALSITMPVAMLLLTWLGFRKMYIERYIWVTMPFFLMVLARGVVDWRINRVARAVATVFVLLIAVGSYGAWLAKSDVWTVYKPNPDWRAAASYLAEESASSGDAVVWAVTPADGLQFYFRTRPVHNPPEIVYCTPTQDISDRLASTGPLTVYVVKNHHWKGGVDEVLQQLADVPGLQPVGSRSFKGLELYAFEWPGG